MGEGKPWREAWERVFGDVTAAFEARWRDYWLNVPDHPTADLYARGDDGAVDEFFGESRLRKSRWFEFGRSVLRRRPRKVELEISANRNWLPPIAVE